MVFRLGLTLKVCFLYCGNIDRIVTIINFTVYVVVVYEDETYIVT